MSTFTYRLLLFLLPIVLGYLILEAGIRQMPSGVKSTGAYLKDNADKIEILVLGASQNQGAINPEYIQQPTLNMASGHQGFQTDSRLLKELYPRLPKLKTVILPLTFGHLETAPNPPNYWKRNAYLYFYDLNTFNRSVYFKDRLLYISNPGFYTSQLKKHYLQDDTAIYNRYGYTVQSEISKFEQLQYNAALIDQSEVRINNIPDIGVLPYNTQLLNEMLAFCTSENIAVVMTLTPTYASYKAKRNPDILRRRDSVLQIIRKTYPSVNIFNEESSEDYEVSDFLNENHLNAKGAKKFTRKLNGYLRQSLQTNN